MNDIEREPRAAADRRPGERKGEVALVLSGGGARAAYQVGMLRHLARRWPDLSFPIITGVSAGAINAVFLASHTGNFREATEALERIWSRLEVGRIFSTRGISLGKNILRWALRLASGGGGSSTSQVRAMLDTEPLRNLLIEELGTGDQEIEGIRANLLSGRLKALALTTLNYTTGQTVTWVQGRDIETWERPNRTSRQVTLTVDHVMASSALPLIFPAVQLSDGWHGDGGVRLAAPLSPAVHLGASSILAVSTRHQRATSTPEMPVDKYPPPAQILGKMLNAVFLDILDQDAARLEKINELVAKVPPESRGGMREIGISVLRPSQDLGRLSAEYEPQLPGAFRYLTRSLGTRETKSPDFLSLLMFQPDYLKRLIDIGEADAEKRADYIAGLLGLA